LVSDKVETRAQPLFDWEWLKGQVLAILEVTRVELGLRLFVFLKILRSLLLLAQHLIEQTTDQEKVALIFAWGALNDLACLL
jgi:hypothetical protein